MNRKSLIYKEKTALKFITGCLCLLTALPSIRAKVKRDLAARAGADVRRGTVLAAIVRLLDTTLVRVGNDEYAHSDGSFGLTTLRKRHVDMSIFKAAS
jgi:DNA topoisomerase IB